MQCGIWNHTVELLYYGLLKSTGLSCTLNGSFICVLFSNIFWKILIHWVIHLFQMLNIFSFYYIRKLHLLIPPQILFSVLIIWLVQVLQKSDFHLYTWIFSLAINSGSCFSWQIHFVHFCEDTEVLNKNHLSVLLKCKNVTPGEKWLSQLTT